MRIGLIVLYGALHVFGQVNISVTEKGKIEATREEFNTIPGSLTDPIQSKVNEDQINQPNTTQEAALDQEISKDSKTINPEQSTQNEKTVEPSSDNQKLTPTEENSSALYLILSTSSFGTLMIVGSIMYYKRQLKNQRDQKLFKKTYDKYMRPDHELSESEKDSAVGSLDFMDDIIGSLQRDFTKPSMAVYAHDPMDKTLPINVTPIDVIGLGSAKHSNLVGGRSTENISNKHGSIKFDTIDRLINLIANVDSGIKDHSVKGDATNAKVSSIISDPDVIDTQNKENFKPQPVSPTILDTTVYFYKDLTPIDEEEETESDSVISDLPIMETQNSTDDNQLFCQRMSLYSQDINATSDRNSVQSKRESKFSILSDLPVLTDGIGEFNEFIVSIEDEKI